MKKKRITIVVNEEEYEAFKSHKVKSIKSGQFLVYRALEKAGLFKKAKLNNKHI